MPVMLLATSFGPERQENAGQHGWKISHAKALKGKQQ